VNPKYPVYVPTKGRFATRMTARALERIGVPFVEVVEKQEVSQYKNAGAQKLLVLPHQNKGLVVTRNWIWDHALASGAEYFWTIDDNIYNFYRLNHNTKISVADGTIFAVMESFTERYENLLIAGMNYEFFVTRREPRPPFTLNTRVYSNMLIKTDGRNPTGHPYRNEGFYNDDTDLCLRILKDGFCTVLFNAFLIKKSVTMRVAGGMTPHYQGDGRWKMAEELRKKHPDVTKVVKKWGRWQHQVDYRGFKKNKLKRKPGVKIKKGVDNFGMYLRYKAGAGLLGDSNTINKHRAKQRKRRMR